MCFAADRRLNVFLKQRGVYVHGIAHVPMKTFIPLATAIVQEVLNVSAVSAGKMVRKSLTEKAWLVKIGLVSLIK